MSGNTIRSKSGHRLLRDPGLHPKHPRRHSVVGLFLDQHRGFASTRLARSTHCAYDDDHERFSTCFATASFLHQGRRCVDDPLFVVRVRVVDRVRRRQRAGASSTGNRCPTMSFKVRFHCQVDDDQLPAQ